MSVSRCVLCSFLAAMIMEVVLTLGKASPRIKVLDYLILCVSTPETKLYGIWRNLGFVVLVIGVRKNTIIFALE